ncbi:MAG: peptide chain release factor N(5)-glutamine methyltransferase [Candidatus Omnitrophica bacterium]|nr:peptide chain release factor N(5)-glutamine methyltransferase [Candidatus Omnitrophota bacterium]
MKIQEVDYSETVPIQYELKNAEFMGMDIYVDERVLIPRPETELLIRTAANICKENGINAPLLLDIGTGSGIVSVGLTKLIENADVIGVDVSLDALEVARINVEKHVNSGSRNSVDLLVSDLFEELEKYKGKFDGIVSNPPYVSDKDYDMVDAWVKAEPELAFKGGIEGMDVIKKIILQAKTYLKKGGFLALEIGYDQSVKTQNFMKDNGYVNVEKFKDVNGFDRVIVGGF